MANPELIGNLARNSHNPLTTRAIWNLQDPALLTSLAENDNLPLDQRAQLIALIKQKILDPNPTVVLMADPILRSLCASAVGDEKIAQLLKEDKTLSTRQYLSHVGLRGASDNLTRSFIKELTPKLANLWQKIPVSTLPRS